MIKKIVSAILSAVLLMSLCGCDFFAAQTEELLSPPSLSGELKPINDAIEKSTNGVYTFEYPTRGDYRTAVVQFDIDGDGILEAFGFYSQVEGDITFMNLNALTCKDGKWKSASHQKIVAGGVDKLEFCDLDGDGIKEILVGWEIYGTSEMQLGVYSLENGKLRQRLLQQYVHFVTCDLNEDGIDEIMIVKINSTEQINSVSLYNFNNEGFNELVCELDSTAKTINEPIIATLSTGKPAAYIDEIKGAGAVTEVIFLEEGVLKNPLFLSETKETLITLRSSTFLCKDIDGNDILEIPVQVNVPSVAKTQVGEKLYIIDWCSFNGEKLTKQVTTMINVDDGYYYTLSEKWAGKIAVLKDTENHLREIYKYNPEDLTVGESLIYIKAVPKRDWDEGKYKAAGVYEIMNDGETAFICRISDTAVNEGITIDEVKKNFKLYE